MPIFKTIPVSGGLIGIWHLTETLDELCAYFAEDELTAPDLNKYTFEKRKKEWLATRALLQQLTGEKITVSYTETGKPLLIHHQYKHLSISHSQEYVAIFLHQKLEVGIDIENKNRNYNSIEKRFLSLPEIEQVRKDPLLQCLYWCTKEAVFKLISQDGISFKEQIHIFPFNPEIENKFKVQFVDGESKTDYTANFIIFYDHCMVWITA
jgi:phosphopantetheinyl transferase